MVKAAGLDRGWEAERRWGTSRNLFYVGVHERRGEDGGGHDKWVTRGPRHHVNQ